MPCSLRLVCQRLSENDGAGNAASNRLNELLLRLKSQLADHRALLCLGLARNAFDRSAAARRLDPLRIGCGRIAPWSVRRASSGQDWILSRQLYGVNERCGAVKLL
jgi:hypothetical protein